MKNKLLCFFFLGSAALLAACKRTDVFGGIEPNTSRVMAEFTDAAAGTHISPSFSSEPVTINLTELRLEPRTLTNHATRVSVTENPAIVRAYNEANGTSYEAPPAAGFSLTPTSYTLSPENRSTMVRGVVRPSALLNAQYAVGLSIAEMSDGDISQTARNVVVFLSIKNDYDGLYSLKGFSNIPASNFTGPFSLSCSQALEVATSGSSAVFLSPSQPAYSNGSFTYISNLLPEFVFDKATNKIAAVNARNGSLDLIFPFDATYDSRYDASTKTIYVKYGVAPAGSGRYIVDTLTFCKPR